jgi:transketolase
VAQFVNVKDVYGGTLVELGSQYPDLFVIEADLMKASGSSPFLEAFADRHINVGIAEQNLIGVAAGIAAVGGIPFASTMANFMTQRAGDQFVIAAGYNQFNVKLVGSYAGLTQEKNGGTHISVLDMAVARAVPNMSVVVPGDCIELAEAMRVVAGLAGPVYLRMPKLLAADVLQPRQPFRFGRARQFGDGTDVTVVSTGLTTAIAIEALDALSGEGIAGRVLHVPTIKPAPREAIAQCAAETRAFVTVENHSVNGGLGGLVAEIVSELHPRPVRRIGLPDEFGLTATLEFQLEHFGITVPGIVAAAGSALQTGT